MYRVKTNKHGGMILDKDITTFEQAKRRALEFAELLSVMVDGGPMILSFNDETSICRVGWGEYIFVEKY